MLGIAGEVTLQMDAHSSSSYCNPVNHQPTTATTAMSKVSRAVPHDAVCKEQTTCSFSCLPSHLQSLILAHGGAPLNTCKAAAAIVSDAALLASWLMVRRPVLLLLFACDRLKRWDVCQHLLSLDSRYTAAKREPCNESELYAVLSVAALKGQLKLVNAILSLVKLHPGPTKDSWGDREEVRAAQGDVFAAVGRCHPLPAAASGGHLEVCRVLLAAGVTGVTAREALCRAACHGHLEVVQLIEQWNVPGMEETIPGLDPLHSAARGGHAATLHYFLDKAAAGGYTSSSAGLLHDLICASWGLPSALQVLLGRPELEWDEGCYFYAMQQAVDGGHMESLRLLVPRLPARLIKRERQHPARWKGTQLLVFPGRRGQTDMVQLLLEEVDWDKSTLQEALRQVTSSGHVNVLQLLLDRGASVNGNSPGFSDQSPLYAAILNNRLDIMEWLLERGAATSDLALVAAIIKTSFGYSKLQRCQLLVQHGTQDPSGHALFEAARCGYEEIVQLLLSPGSGAPQTEEEQLFRWEVALCGAASMGREGVVKDLLRAMPAVAEGTTAAAPEPTSLPSPAVAPPTDTVAAQSVGQQDVHPAPPPLRASVMHILTKAMAAVQQGKGYWRPDHPRCTWPAHPDDDFGDLNWLRPSVGDYVPRGLSAEFVMELLLKAAGRYWREGLHDGPQLPASGSRGWSSAVIALPD
jgi:ankyrin repeat protein